MAEFKITRGTQAAYNALQTKDPDTLYVRTDSHNIYLGSILLFEEDAFKSVSISGKTLTFTTHGANGTTGSKTLSLSDFATTDEVAAAIAAAAVQSDWEQTDNTATDYIKNKPRIKAGEGTYSTIEGHFNSKALGTGAHAEGYYNAALGLASHAEGYGASFSSVFLNGSGTTYTVRGAGVNVGDILTLKDDSTFYATVLSVSGTTITVDTSLGDGNLLAVRLDSYALGRGSHVEGCMNVANNNYEHAEGQYNVSMDGNTSADQTISTIGIGTANNARKNAVDVRLNGDVYIDRIGNYNGTGDTETLQDVISGIQTEIESVSGDIKTYTIEETTPSHQTGVWKQYNLVDSDGDTCGDTITIPSNPDWKEDVSSSLDYIKNRPNLREGEDEGIIEGNINDNISYGEYAHAEGDATFAMGDNSHTEGNLTVAQGDNAHAEGLGVNDTLSLTGSDVIYTVGGGVPLGIIGAMLLYKGTIATVTYATKSQITLDTTLGTFSKATDVIWLNSGAIGNNSHVEGEGTIALNSNEHAQGQYNVSNTGKISTIHSIGIGQDDAHRQNAVEVLNDGDVFIYGIGDYDGSDPGNATSLQSLIGGVAASIHQYTIASTTPDTGYLTAYQLKQDNSFVGAKINIPKDFLVKSGDVIDVVEYNGEYYDATDTEHENPLPVSQAGKYLDFVVNVQSGTATDEHIYILVSDLVDVYTEGNGIDISSGNVVSVVIDQNSSNGLSVSASGIALATATTSSAGAMSAADKTKLEGIASGAEVNQNAFSNVVVGNTTIAADSKTDTLTLEAGNNITLTPDSTNDKVTIAASVPSPADATPLMDGTAAVGTSTDYAREDHVHPSDTSKVDKVSSSTDNAIVRFDGTGSAIQNSGVTIDDSNNIVTSGNATVKNLIIQGSNTSNTTRFFTSDDAANIFAQIGTAKPLVIKSTEIRRSTNDSSVNLGSSSYPWNNVYAKKFITNGGTSSQLVCGDGTLATISTTDQYEAYLLWGGKNFSGNNCSPVDAALVSELGANRSQFLSPTYISVEYSRDGGETWIDYEATDAQKGKVFSVWELSGLRLGKATTKGEMTSAYMLRVTITDTYNASFYGTYNKFVIYCTTEGASGCYCTIQGRTKANVDNSTDTWTTFRDQVGIGGWSGYNVINYPSGFTTYGSGGQSSYYRQVRFVFGCTGGPSSSYYGFQLGKIMCFSKASYSTPSNMARHGHLYSWNRSQEATFPAKVTAPTLCASSKLTVGTDGDVTQYMVYDGKEIVDELGTTYPLKNHYIDNSGTWISSTTYGHYVIPITGVRMVRLKAKSDNAVFYSFIKNYVFASPPTSDYAEGYTSREQRPHGQEVELVVPSDAEYLFIYPGSKSSQPYKPDSIKLYGSMITRTHNEDVYYDRIEPLTAEDAVVSDWRDHDVTSMILSVTIRYGYINSSNIYKTSTNSAPYYSAYVPLSSNLASIKVVAGLANTKIAFLTIEGVTNNVTPPFSSGTTPTTISAGNTQTFNVPSDAKYLYVYLGTLSNDVYSAMPKDLCFTGKRGVELFPLTINNTVYNGSYPVTFSGIAEDSNVVHLTGDETITDLKTFKDGIEIGQSTNTIVPIDIYADAFISGTTNIGVLQMSDNINDGAIVLRGINTPRSNSDAVNKKYVDDIVGDIESLLAAI